MERIEVFEKLEKIFKGILKDDTLKLLDTTTAMDVDGWDSLAHMLIITDIEEMFQIKFKLKDLMKMKNVGALVDIIISKL